MKAQVTEITSSSTPLSNLLVGGAHPTNYLRESASSALFAPSAIPLRSLRSLADFQFTQRHQET